VKRTLWLILNTLTMKKIVYHFVLLSILVLSTAASCNKPNEEQSLPTGENTMYYYVNGNLHIPEGDMFSRAIVYSICDIDSPTFHIASFKLSIQFYNGIQQTGYITLNQSNSNSSCQINDSHAYFSTHETDDNGNINSINYYTHDGSGIINITYLSEDKRKFKGTFEMTVFHEITGQEKQITEGHFNINLDTLND
jgi:hypothetical protein